MCDCGQLFLEFQKEIEQEKVRRLQIMRQLEAERYRISMQKWVKDEGVDNCSSCSSEFSLFKRKVRTISVFSTLLSLSFSLQPIFCESLPLQHHCRSCGNIFCHNCSSKTALTTAGPQPVRVCDECFSKIEKYDPPAESQSQSNDLDTSIANSIPRSPSKISVSKQGSLNK